MDQKAKEEFLASIPNFIKNEVQKNFNSDMIDMYERNRCESEFKLLEIEEAIEHELKLYSHLKDLKKQNNQHKRLSIKKRLYSES